MPRLIRNTLVSVRDLIAAAGPLSYADQLYGLRSHIRLVRERLSSAKEV